MPVNHFLFGKRTDGFTRKIQGAGFNGIAGITWDEEFRMKTEGKLGDGLQCDATSHRSKTIAEQEISVATLGKDKLCFTGRMIVGNFNNIVTIQHLP